MSEATITGRSLRHRREQLGLGLHDLARRFGVEPFVVSEWETGTRPHPHPQILSLALTALEAEADRDT